MLASQTNHTVQKNTSARRRLQQRWAYIAPFLGCMGQWQACQPAARSQTHLWQKQGEDSSQGRCRHTAGWQESGHDPANSITRALVSFAWSSKTSPPAGNWNSPQLGHWKWRGIQEQHWPHLNDVQLHFHLPENHIIFVTLIENKNQQQPPLTNCSSLHGIVENYEQAISHEKGSIISLLMPLLIKQ